MAKFPQVLRAEERKDRTESKDSTTGQFTKNPVSQKTDDVDPNQRRSTAQLAGLFNTNRQYISEAEAKKRQESTRFGGEGPCSLTASQKAAVATDMLPWYEKEAEKFRLANLKNQDIEVENLPHREGRSRDKLGETIGVSGHRFLWSCANFLFTLTLPMSINFQPVQK